VLLLRHDGLTQDDGADAGFADVLLFADLSRARVEVH